MNISGKVVVVTGGASGIGRALCRRFAQEGAKGITVADRNGEGAKAVAGEIKGLAVTCDVAKEDHIIGLVKQTEETFGPIDLFCSNAGYTIEGDVDIPNEGWQQLWEVHVMAHVYAARAVIPGMIERGGGYLMSTSSAAGLLTSTMSSAYATTKHAVIGLAENIAVMYGDQGIRVSVLCPQAVQTGLSPEGGGKGVADVDGRKQPEEVADIVIEALAEERFLILSHPEVKTYMDRKVSDYDRWISGMIKLRKRYLEGQPLKKA